jgi:hypothetical protein
LCISLKQGENSVELGSEHSVYMQNRQGDPDSETQHNRKTAVDYRINRYDARAYEGKF